MDSSADWWNRFEVPEGHTGRWRLGPFHLWVKWSPPEWRVAYLRGNDPEENGLEVVCPAPPEEDPEEGVGERMRIVSGDPSNALSLTPKLADKPIVARPETPFQVLSGATITLYVSSPLWIVLQVGEGMQQILDLASWPMSETWFGPSTIEGELCYAIKSSARFHLENVAPMHNRAITRVRLENRTSENVSLERLTLPAPNLSLYCDAEGRFWTQAVRVKLNDVDKTAEVDLGKGPPEEAKDPRRVSGPRTHAHRGILLRARNALLT